MADINRGHDARVTHGIHRNESVVFVELTRGRKAIVDADIWPRIERDFGRRWMCIGGGRGHYYATKNTHDSNGLRSHVTLGRAVMQAEPGERVEAQNGDALDCRRRNLEKLTTSTANERRRKYAKKRERHLAAKRAHAAENRGNTSRSWEERPANRGDAQGQAYGAFNERTAAASEGTT